jgi:8-oxo-dGTP pyrophosphatase MutT (NUDIX family)
MSIERETSYGGVVVRGQDVMVIVPRGRRRVLGLPKGGANAGESPEETAAREVREETGITATVRDRLGQVDYTYRRGGRQVAKTVHFYLCEFEDGDTADHDHEVDDGRSTKRAGGSATPASAR